MGNPFMKLILVNKNGKIEKMLVLHRQFSKFCKKSGKIGKIVSQSALKTSISRKPRKIANKTFLYTKSLGNGLSEIVCHCSEAFGV